MPQRAVDLCPKLANYGGVENLEVVRYGVGLRPARKGGIRLESEHINGILVVHSYGHAGYGYQTSWACAEEVVKIVAKTL
jgi:D-amino-acid oxidase